MTFKNKKAIVTGANRSMGQAIGLALAEQGADVVISYRRDEAGAEHTVKQIQQLGRRAAAFYADFSQSENVETFFESALSELGHIDYLINNAAMLSRENVFDITPEKMAMVFQVNTVAPFHLSQLCASHMREHNIQGAIVNISSIAAATTFKKGVAYAASKAALNKTTQHAALAFADAGIRVNAIAPGVIEAGMNETTADTLPELWQTYLEAIPLKRTGTPDDIANMALFLLSDKAKWITGKVFEIDGGHIL